MSHRRAGLVAVALCIVAMASVAYASGLESALADVEWLYHEDFTRTPIEEYPVGWAAFANRTVSWRVTEFEASESGRALWASNRDDKINRAILEFDIPQQGTRQIIFETVVWADLLGLPGVDLFTETMAWPNVMSVHPWNLGIFATTLDIKPYHQVVVFDLETSTADVYIDGKLVKEELPFRADGSVGPDNLFRVGLSFAGSDGSSDVYWEYVRVGIR